nr:major head protein [Microvirus sp.]
MSQIGYDVSRFDVPQMYGTRSVIECPSNWKGTFNSGYLIPFFWCPVLPGDTMHLNTTFFCRMSTQVLPPMDNIYLDFHFWFVADRLRWNNFRKFMGEQENPGDSVDYVEPVINSGTNGFDYESVFDYIGVPPKVPNLDVNAGLFRDMVLIWNNFYRDENLQDSLPVNLGDGPDPVSNFPLLRRGKRGDYFTVGMISPQKFGQSVTLPLGSTAPVYGLKNPTTGQLNPMRFQYIVPSHGTAVFEMTRQGGTGATVNAMLNTREGTGDTAQGNVSVASKEYYEGKNYAPLYADLTDATSATINTIRQAVALQHFLERDMIRGTRYFELVKSHFGVDAEEPSWLPEFIGGTTSMIQTNVVPQTSGTTDASPQANLSAYSTAGGTQIGFTRSFVEHGFIIGFVCARTDLTYQQGLDRLLSKRTRYDYYWDDLAHLGYQDVKNKEIFAQGKNVLNTAGSPVDDDTFNYNVRYDEYRFKTSLITGKFRSSHPQSLQNYHYSQYFANLPKFNEEFIQVPVGKDSPIRRSLAVVDEPEFLMDCYHDLVKYTSVDVDGTPGLMRL